MEERYLHSCLADCPPIPPIRLEIEEGLSRTRRPLAQSRWRKSEPSVTAKPGALEVQNAAFSYFCLQRSSEPPFIVVFRYPAPVPEPSVDRFLLERPPPFRGTYKPCHPSLSDTKIPQRPRVAQPNLEPTGRRRRFLSQPRFPSSTIRISSIRPKRSSESLRSMLVISCMRRRRYRTVLAWTKRLSPAAPRSPKASR